MWRKIPNIPEVYEVNEDGSFRKWSAKSGWRLMRGTTDNKGYRRVSVSINGKFKNMQLHRLVAYAFIGVSELTVDHIDGDKLNNHVSNLQYLSRGDNARKNVEDGNGSLDKPIKITNRKTGEVTYHRSGAEAGRHYGKGPTWAYKLVVRGGTKLYKGEWIIETKK